MNLQANPCSGLTAFVAFAAIFLVGCSQKIDKPGLDTYRYLREVGRVRMLINTEDNEFPRTGRLQDMSILQRSAMRASVYEELLANLPKNGVDQDAVQVAENIESILRAYKAVCLDMVTLYKERRIAGNIGPNMVIPITMTFLDIYTDRLDKAAGDLIKVLEEAQKHENARDQFLAPFIEKIRMDRDSLAAAKLQHHEFSIQVRDRFTEKYPDQDWTLPEILPQDN